MCILSWVMVIKKCIIFDHSLVTGSILYVFFFRKYLMEPCNYTRSLCFIVYYYMWPNINSELYIYLSDIHRIFLLWNVPLLFVMFLCMAKMSTGFCIANDMKVPRMITLTLHCARCSEYFWMKEKMWIVHTINFRRKSVFDPVNYSRSKELYK